MSTKQVYDRIQNTSAGDTDRILDIMLEILAEIDRIDRDVQLIRSMQGDVVSDELEDAQWSGEFPKVDGFYWMRNFRHYRPLPVEVEGDSLSMMFGTGRYPKEMFDSAEFLGPIAPSSDTVRQARQETWNSVISKLNERAEDWRLQAERWQKQAENETNEAIRDLSFSDRDACLSKMSALKTFAIEAAALRAEGEKGDEIE